jgi:PqqD family protein of HPr-rel-A system
MRIDAQRDAAFRARSGLDITEVDDGLIIYDPTTGKVHHLNQTASVVFALCDGRDVTEIAAEVAAVFGMSDAPLRDAKACLADLADRGLLD